MGPLHFPCFITFPSFCVNLFLKCRQRDSAITTHPTTPPPPPHPPPPTKPQTPPPLCLRSVAVLRSIFLPFSAGNLSIPGRSDFSSQLGRRILIFSPPFFTLLSGRRLLFRAVLHVRLGQWARPLIMCCLPMNFLTGDGDLFMLPLLDDSPPFFHYIVKPSSPDLSPCLLDIGLTAASCSATPKKGCRHVPPRQVYSTTGSFSCSAIFINTLTRPRGLVGLSCRPLHYFSSGFFHGRFLRTSTIRWIASTFFDSHSQGFSRTSSVSTSTVSQRACPPSFPLLCGPQRADGMFESLVRPTL